MLGSVAAFEFRYQVTSPLFRAAAAIIFLLAFADMAVIKLGLVIGGGQVLFNAPHAIVVTHLIFSMVFLFLGAAFVSNVVVRDDQTGFGPIIRSTGLGKRDYLLGRFAGAFAAGALILATVPLATWVGTLMPFANQEMLGPNRLSGFITGYGLFALPNAFIMSSVLFALATITRSTAGTFVGVIALFLHYLIGQGLMNGQDQSLRMLADLFGMSTYMSASRYLTASELNAGALPVSALMIASRLLWVGAGFLLLALTVYRFRFSEGRISRRRQRKLAREAAAMLAPPMRPALARLPEPAFGRRTSRAQFLGRAAMEARYIFKSPLFLFLLIIAFFVTFLGLLAPTGWMDLPVYPLTSIAVPIVDVSFRTILLIIATYYGGELVWRERERKLHEIIDATPLPAWALMLPKMLGLALVLMPTLLVGTGAGLLAQILGGLAPQVGQFAAWYLLPASVDALLFAVLAVFVAAVSPGKYAAWGIMFAYTMLLTFGPSLGLAYPLLIYGNTPAVPLSEIAGTAAFAPAAWWFRLFWATAAMLLLVVANQLWPRGTDQGLMVRLRAVRFRGASGAAAILSVLLLALTGGWIVYNTRVLNPFVTSAEQERHLAEYERRYFRFADLPQPEVGAVTLEVALFPEELRADVRGRYVLLNATNRPIEQVHLRLMNPELTLVALDFPGARLERDDRPFDYRIYRLDRPMQPGERRFLSFRTTRRQQGFTAANSEMKLTPNGTVIDTLALTPRIGMSDVGLIEDPIARRRQGLPDAPPFPRLGDMAAVQRIPNGADGGFTTMDVTISTSADQVPISSGRRVYDRIENGRRIARFVSDGPTKNLVPIQSGRFARARQVVNGVDIGIYYDPAQPWNVERMMEAARASLDYYRAAFGPYQFGELSLVESPYGQGGHAYPNNLSIGAAIFSMDLRDPAQLDMVTMLTAHEIAHQWWGHQVLGARMQGGSLLYESLAQYSALIVLKKLRGEDDIRRFLTFQRDRYLGGRRTQTLAEQPLAGVEISQQHIAYGKGALALYHLQQRIGEAAVNRALRRFVERYRFASAPYPRSLDLIALLRAETRTADDQQWITDMFERITLWDLKLGRPTARRRPDGKWDVAVPVEARKLVADGQGRERPVPMDDRVALGLFTDSPDDGAGSAANTIRIASVRIRDGRQTIRLVTDRMPGLALIDPDHAFIDRDVEDNRAAFGS